MRQEALVFDDTETALITIQEMAVAFDEAVVMKDVQAINEMYRVLAEAVAEVTRLVQTLGVGLSDASMVGRFPPERWKDMSPEAILLDLRDLAAIDGIAIQIVQAKVLGSRPGAVKQLFQKETSLNKKLKNKIGSARAWIKKNWPLTWTDAEDDEFWEWLN